MPHIVLDLQEKEIRKLLKRNTLLSALCILSGVGLMIPSFTLQGSKFQYQEFCFKPSIIDSNAHYCEGSKIRRGIAWRVALEKANNNEFITKVTLLNLIPAQNPNAGWYGVSSALFLATAYFFFKNGTEQLENNLDLVVSNKKAVITERESVQNTHLNLKQLQAQQSEELQREIMQREQADIMYQLVSEGERKLMAENQAKAEQLKNAGFELDIATLKAQKAEQEEKQTKHKVETAKLNKATSSEEKNSERRLETLLKEHEGGWLWDIARGRMPIIIYGRQGSYKSYTAACLAILKAQFQDAQLVSICDPHAHQNRDEAWRYLIALEPDVYGSNDRWDEYAEGIDAAHKRWSQRTLKDSPIISIWDELTTMGQMLSEYSQLFMPKIVSAPRKANENTIIITHSLTNAGLGGVEGMSEAIKDGCLRLKLKANSLQQPLFKGSLMGWVDSDGNEIEEMNVTLPNWLRPEKLQEMTN